MSPSLLVTGHCLSNRSQVRGVCSPSKRGYVIWWIYHRSIQYHVPHPHQSPSAAIPCHTLGTGKSLRRVIIQHVCVIHPFKPFKRDITPGGGLKCEAWVWVCTLWYRSAVSVLQRRASSRNSMAKSFKLILFPLPSSSLSLRLWLYLHLTPVFSLSLSTPLQAGKEARLSW